MSFNVVCTVQWGILRNVSLQDPAQIHPYYLCYTEGLLHICQFNTKQRFRNGAHFSHSSQLSLKNTPAGAESVSSEQAAVFKECNTFLNTKKSAQETTTGPLYFYQTRCFILYMIFTWSSTFKFFCFLFLIKKNGFKAKEVGWCLENLLVSTALIATTTCALHLLSAQTALQPATLHHAAFKTTQSSHQHPPHWAR